MDIKERIAALPKYPPDFTGDLGSANSTWWGVTLREQRDAALARLALAREWINRAPHNCSFLPAQHGLPEVPCTCGRDALLKALEVPK